MLHPPYTHGALSQLPFAMSTTRSLPPPVRHRIHDNHDRDNSSFCRSSPPQHEHARISPRWRDGALRAPEEDAAPAQPVDPLGTHTAARYRAFLHLFARRDAAVSETAFAQLLSVVELADELQLGQDGRDGPVPEPTKPLYSPHGSGMLKRLAHTGHMVVLLVRLNRVLDGTDVLSKPEDAVASEQQEEEEGGITADEQAGWRQHLFREREKRVALFQRLLSEATRPGVATDEGDARDGKPTLRYSLSDEIRDEHDQLQVLTLLKAGLEKYGSDDAPDASGPGDGLAEDMLLLAEQQLIADAFEYVVKQANMVVMAVPP